MIFIVFVFLVEVEQEGEEAPSCSMCCYICTARVPLVPLVYRLFYTKRYSFNVGISSKTICCTACTATFLLIAYRKLHVTRVFLYIKVFDFRRYKRYKVSFPLKYEAKLRTACAF